MKAETSLYWPAATAVVTVRQWQAVGPECDHSVQAVTSVGGDLVLRSQVVALCI